MNIRVVRVWISGCVRVRWRFGRESNVGKVFRCLLLHIVRPLFRQSVSIHVGGLQVHLVDLRLLLHAVVVLTSHSLMNNGSVNRDTSQTATINHRGAHPCRAWHICIKFSLSVLFRSSFPIKSRWLLLALRPTLTLVSSLHHPSTRWICVRLRQIVWTRLEKGGIASVIWKLALLVGLTCRIHWRVIPVGGLSRRIDRILMVVSAVLLSGLLHNLFLFFPQVFRYKLIHIKELLQFWVCFV